MRNVKAPRTRPPARAWACALWALGVTSACSLDWDRLDPSSGAQATGGAAGSASGGGSGDAGGGSSGDTGGSAGSSGGTGGAGGTSGTGGAPAPSCSGSVLANSGFERLRQKAPRNWELSELGGASILWGEETALITEGSRALRLDTRPALATSVPRAALVSSTPVALQASARVTATLAVRVEELAHEEVTVLALFDTGAAEPVEVELASFDQTSPYVTVGNVVDVPDGATTVSLAVASPDGALVYLDDACATLGD